MREALRKLVAGCQRDRVASGTRGNPRLPHSKKSFSSFQRCTLRNVPQVPRWSEPTEAFVKGLTVTLVSRPKYGGCGFAMSLDDRGRLARLETECVSEDSYTQARGRQRAPKPRQADRFQQAMPTR